MGKGERMDDVISRQKAIDALKKDMASLDRIIKGMSANDVRLDAYVSQRNQVNYDIYTINNLPTAQPKRGRWISADAMFGGVPFYCSECGENTWDTVMGKPRWKFCPMCGSRNEVTE